MWDGEEVVVVFFELKDGTCTCPQGIVPCAKFQGGK